MNVCKLCGREIDWMRTEEGRYIPVDPEPVFVIEGEGTKHFYIHEWEFPGLIIGRKARPEEVQTKEAKFNTPRGFVPHWRTCGKVAAMPPSIKNMAEVVIEVSQEYEEAMKKCREMAGKLGENMEELEREAEALARSSTMTKAEAMYHVANRRLHEAEKQNGGADSGGLLPAT